MPRLNPIALSVICALAMAGCAAPLQKQADPPPTVQPVLAVNHGGLTGEGLYRLGRYLEGQARYEHAITAYREALKRDPLLGEAYTGLGMALAAQRRYEDAIRQFQAAVVLAPHSAHAHNNLGYAYLLSGATDQAVKALEEARRLDAGHVRSRENLRMAQANLAAAAQPASPQSATAALAPVTEPVAGSSLVEVMPQVYELRPKQAPVVIKRLGPLPVQELPLNKEPAAAAARNFRLEVSNGNGVTGMARRVAERLSRLGVRTARLTNQRRFAQRHTQIHYRAGYAAEAAALGRQLQPQVELIANNDLAGHIDVRLMLGQDVTVERALIPDAPPRTITAKSL